MEQYIKNEQNPAGSWLYERGSGSEYATIRCPFCGSVFDLKEDAKDLPSTCNACSQIVSGKLEIV